ncbi:capsule biosynthesis protein CapA [Staphylococcus hominis subsp. hominis]|uniref:Wzz/FepE/Etk N-terminal domain-containing protein n=1 Tax=Staphylococcus hominis TaxID=1290 RepID=UPI000CD1B44A|nr:Wzz/FepE/Etk N-terminal domain-containing protein [Staphylococcus hominis]AYY66417.1 capsule biosynthesis protein CapA [Staphylococcus hominis]PNZ33638.1 capsule biosynthesis protein CapA [Staphylococcus hominis subsp. hominis]SUM40737.1 capsular polysaccharide synthesis enzyme CapA [Staphylococcus hominis]
MENTLGLSKLIEILKRKWKLLIMIPILFMIIALLVTLFLMKPQYQANTQVLVNQKEKNSDLMAQEVQSNIQLVNTYSEIIKSPRILDEVAKKENQYTSSDIKNMLVVNTQANSQILNINIKNNNKQKAEKVANDIATVFSKKMPSIMNVDNVSVLSKANGTATKVSPKLYVNIVIGLVIGLLLALGIIILNELLDKRIRNEEDVKSELDIPVLGSIPKIK